MKEQNKTAVCIGINYRGTEYELRGCVNDADDWAKLLTSNGFHAAVLAEKQATKQQIVTSVKQLIIGLKPGDVGFVTYSGHGTWLPDKDGDEPDGKDEAICPIDMGPDGKNLLLDDEFRRMFTGIPTGAHIVFVTDSCHSGHVYRMFADTAEVAYRKPRFVPPITFAQSETMARKVDRVYGQTVVKTDAPLPGLIHFSGCKDAELSNDVEINKRPCGAFSYYAIRAFGRGVALGQTYGEVHAAIRKNLPSHAFAQTPLLNAMSELKKLPVFG